LYVQVVVAVVLGVLVGWLLPDVAKNEWIKAMGTIFVKLVKSIITPLIFCTVFSGILHVQSAAKVGRVALKAIVYFEVVSTFALALGLLVGNVVKPGQGAHIQYDGKDVEKYQKQAQNRTEVDLVLDIVPTTLVSAFTEGEILQVLFVSILVAMAAMITGERATPVVQLVDAMGHIMSTVVAIVMKVAPLGAFGAMAFTVGMYGLHELGSLLVLILTFYLTSVTFVLIVLGAIAAVSGFNILKFLWYLKDELILVVATSSSESALPNLMAKLRHMGCSESVVGLVVPLGYSFNLDGTNVYMTLATRFIAQAMGVNLSLVEQLKVMLVAMLTSKGASGVSGAGFICLASTLVAVRPELAPGMAMLLGIDKFMSECRALTNFCGNGVGTVVMSRWEGELDKEAMRQTLRGKRSLSAPEASIDGDECEGPAGEMHV
jgi:aerobic C4-dicarboxylate transport protein